MAHIQADRVRDTTTTTGTGAITVSGTAPTTYRTFSAVCSSSDTFYYVIQHQSADEWEVGLGTYSGTNQITRSTVYSSSNAGAAVSFSAGTKDVAITLAASRTASVDNTGKLQAFDGSQLTSLNANNISSGTLSNSRLSGVALTANNLSDMTASTVRTNLGLSSLATTSPGTGVVTALGNATNGASGLVTLDASSKLPAVDGSQLTNLTAGAVGGSTDKIFWQNGQTVTTNYTISTNNNAGSFGPITINSGVTVTVPSGSTWVIV